jgi:hypothetical protein
MSQGPEVTGTTAPQNNTITVDERQALLSDRDRPASYVQTQAESGEDVVAHDEETALGTPRSKSRTWASLWTILLSLIGILVLAVFIKGFIDADDTDV